MAQSSNDMSKSYHYNGRRVCEFRSRVHRPVHRTVRQLEYNKVSGDSSLRSYGDKKYDSVMISIRSLQINVFSSFFVV